MLLVLDVGNTQTVIGVYREEKLLAHWRLATLRDRTEDEYGVLLANLFTQKGLSGAEVTASVLSSVVPPLTGAFEKAVAGYFNVVPLVVGPGVKTGIKLKFDNPKEIGADRIVNAVAGYQKYGGPLILVDFGTATTFDFIDAEGVYSGGVIAPGLKISAEALFVSASKLPKVELAYPEHVLGRNTIGSMQSGIMYGYAELVDGLLDKLKQETGVESTIVATGGLATLLAPHTRNLSVVDDWLTLEGLKIIHERNRA